MTQLSAASSAVPSSASSASGAVPTAVASNVREIAASVDVQALADKVYQLLLDDLSLQRRRAGGQGR